MCRSTMSPTDSSAAIACRSPYLNSLHKCMSAINLQVLLLPLFQHSLYNSYNKFQTYLLKPFLCVTKLAPGCTSGPLMTHCCNFLRLCSNTRSGYVKIFATSIGTATFITYLLR